MQSDTIIAIRANAGREVGFGHVRRCVSLATALAARQVSVVFIVNPESEPSAWLHEIPGASVELVSATEIGSLAATIATVAAKRAYALIVDSYDVRAEALADVSVPVAALVDAPPPQALSATLLVNGAANAADHFHPLKDGAEALLGPKYILLRSAFSRLVEHETRSVVSQILVMAGGSDQQGLSSSFVKAARAAVPGACVTAVAGPYVPHEVVQALRHTATADSQLQVLQNPADIEFLMRSADIAVTTGGQTTYELAATGTPTVAVMAAPNQLSNLRGLSDRGTLVWVETASKTALEQQLTEKIAALANDCTVRRAMSSAGQSTVDGLGAERVAKHLLEL